MAHPSLAGRVVIVTGASRGIGREFALALAGAGAKLVLIASRISEVLKHTEADVIAKAGKGNVLTMPCDVRAAANCERAVRNAFEEFGAIHGLVNNAGIGMRHISESFNVSAPPFYAAGADKWDDIVSTNVLGAFYMARYATPYMLHGDFGRIVNISTSHVTMVRKGYSPYGPTKAALEAMTRVWAQDLAETNVTANALLPGGATDTEFLPPGPNRKGADGQLLAPDVMNDALLWLLSDASNGVNGRRLIGKLWDKSLAPDEAARKAMSPEVALPAIL